MRMKLSKMIEHEGSRTRIVIEGVTPEIDGGRFPIKRTIGDKVVVEADIFADGHDVLSAALLYRKEGNPDWIEIPMEFLVNDRWRGSFVVSELGQYQYTITAWVDSFRTWQQNLAKKVEAKQDVSVDFLEGAQLIEEASHSAIKRETGTIRGWVETLRSREASTSAKAKLALSQKVTKAMNKYSDRQFASAYSKELVVVVDREKARFSTWYEMFPRSVPACPSLVTMAPLRTARCAFPISRRWVLMCYTFRRSTRLAIQAGRGRIMPLPPSPVTLGHPGPSARRREDTRRFILSSAL